MNYEQNNVRWSVGDIVIHDCDAKRKNMLMRVSRIYQNDEGQMRYVCKYIDEEYHMGSKGLTQKEFNEWNSWDNSLKPLHDPERFDLEKGVV